MTWIGLLLASQSHSVTDTSDQHTPSSSLQDAADGADVGEPNRSTSGQFMPSFDDADNESITHLISAVSSEHTTCSDTSSPVFQHESGTVIGNSSSKSPKPWFDAKNNCEFPEVP